MLIHSYYYLYQQIIVMFLDNLCNPRRYRVGIRPGQTVVDFRGALCIQIIAGKLADHYSLSVISSPAKWRMTGGKVWDAQVC